MDLVFVLEPASLCSCTIIDGTNVKQEFFSGDIENYLKDQYDIFMQRIKSITFIGPNEDYAKHIGTKVVNSIMQKYNKNIDFCFKKKSDFKR